MKLSEITIGARVSAKTRQGWIGGNVVTITRAGSVGVQLDGYADLVYRRPENVLPRSGKAL